MLFSTIGQEHIFLWMVGAGLLIGALYGLQRILCKLLEAGFMLTLAADLIFGIAAAAILLLALITGCYGELRLYQLLGVLAGVLLFRTGIEAPLLRFFHRVFRKLRIFYVRLSKFHLVKVIFK
ncbi:MAG: spore cortex biosynthesis protein YabQ [Christensenellales bacterium]|nr:spore cortex biosynthesis protein YabQ [Christensenellales bacterium]